MPQQNAYADHSTKLLQCLLHNPVNEIAVDPPPTSLPWLWRRRSQPIVSECQYRIGVVPCCKGNDSVDKHQKATLKIVRFSVPESISDNNDGEKEKSDLEDLKVQLHQTDIEYPTDQNDQRRVEESCLYRRPEAMEQGEILPVNASASSYVHDVPYGLPFDCPMLHQWRSDVRQPFRPGERGSNP